MTCRYRCKEQQCGPARKKKYKNKQNRRIKKDKLKKKLILCFLVCKEMQG